eukprot:11251898-Alexandrium_andersonii.AAC.1
MIAASQAAAGAPGVSGNPADDAAGRRGRWGDCVGDAAAGAQRGVGKAGGGGSGGSSSTPAAAP